MFGKKSEALRKAEEQRKIDKLKNKTRKEDLKLKEKQAKIDTRAKAGGIGFTLHDKPKLKGGKDRWPSRGTRRSTG